MSKITLVLFLLSVARLCSAQAITSISFTEALEYANNQRPSLTGSTLRLDAATLSAKSESALPGLKFGVGQSTHPLQGLGATDLDLYVSQTVDVFGRSRAQRSVGEAYVNLAQQQRHSQKLKVSIEVAEAFCRSYTATIKARKGEDLKALAAEVARLTDQLVKGGKVPATHFIRANIESLKVEEASRTLDASAKAESVRLSAMIGLQEKIVAPSIVSFKISRPKLDYSKQLELAQLSLENKVTSAKIESLRKDLSPQLEFLVLRSPWGFDSSFVGARFQLSVPLGDNGRTAMAVKAKQKEISARESEATDLKIRLMREGEATLLELAGAEARLQLDDKVIQQSVALLDKVKKGFAEGFNTQMDVMDALKCVFDSELARADHELQLRLLELKLCELTGTVPAAAGVEVEK